MNQLQGFKHEFIPADEHEIPDVKAVYAAFVDGDMREPFKVFASEFNARRFALLTIGRRFSRVEIREVYTD